MDLKWEYYFDKTILNGLVAKLKNSSDVTILSVYKNRLGYSSVVSSLYSSFIHPCTIFYPNILAAQSAMHIPYSLENQTRYAVTQIEKDFYSQRDNISKLLSLKK